MKVRMDAEKLAADDPIRSEPATAGERDPMSYAEAKQVALLRLDLRACWASQDHAGAAVVLAQLSKVVGNDNELAAEVRRWTIKLQEVA